MSSLLLSGPLVDASHVNTGIAASPRMAKCIAGTDDERAGAGWRFVRTGRGVALGLTASSAAGALFFAAILLDFFVGERAV
jgi:hypothetical protein